MVADISILLNTIKNAIYGKDMRDAIHDSIKTVNDECSEDTAKIVDLTEDVADIKSILPNTVKYNDNEVDSWVLPLPLTDTSNVNTMYKIIEGDWLGNSQSADSYWRFSYKCFMTNAKIVNEGEKYYLYCGINDIPNQLWCRQYGNFKLVNDLSVFNIQLSYAVCQFSFNSVSGNIGTEVLKFNCSIVYGPDDLFKTYMADKFIDGVYSLGTVTTYWGLKYFRVGDNFVLREKGFDKLCGNYASDDRVSMLENSISQRVYKKTVRTSISNNTLVLTDNTDTRLISADVSTLIVKTPNTFNDDYECWFSFKSGETPTTLTYSSTPIKWVGIDCDEAGDFVPVSNMIYEVGIKMIGKDSDGAYVIIARVGGC